MTTAASPRVVACPVCRKPVEWRSENAFRPFCSERCKKMDLGAWASDEYRVSGSESGPGATDGGDAMGAGEAR